MKDLPWFPFYAADFITDPRVQDLSLEARGLYITCLAWQWTRNYPLPLDLAKLARVVGCDREEVERLWPDLVGLFMETGSGWQDMNLEAIRQEAILSHERRVAAGRAGGRRSGEERRKRSRSIASSNAEPMLQAMPKPNGSNASSNGGSNAEAVRIRIRDRV